MANIDIGGRLHSTATGNVVAGANEILDDSKGKKQSTINAEVDAALEGKQDEIADLSTIRSGAAAGATAYQKPGTGIPATDMASEVQTSLGKADSAYQKPSGGIPKTDLESGVQDSLELADSAVQADPIGSIVPPVDPSEFATKEEVEELEAKVTDLGQGVTEQIQATLSAEYPDINKRINSSGEEVATGGYETTGFVPIANVTAIHLKGHGTSTTKLLCFYSGNTESSFISAYPNIANVDVVIKSTDFPSNATFVRACSIRANEHQLLLIYSATRFDELLSRIADTNRNVSENAKGIEALYGKSFTVTPQIQRTDKYIKSDGSVADGSGYVVTSPIHLLKGQKLTVTSYITSGGCQLAITDENGTTYTPVFVNTGSSGGQETNNYIASADCYVAWSYLPSQPNSASFSAMDDIYGISQKIEGLSSEEGQTDSLVKQIYGANVPISPSSQRIDTSINADGTINTGANGYVVSVPIKLLKGQKIDISSYMHRDGCYLALTDENGTTYTPIFTRDSADLRDYSYLAVTDCYVAWSYLTSQPHSAIIHSAVDIYEINRAINDKTSIEYFNPSADYSPKFIQAKKKTNNVEPLVLAVFSDIHGGAAVNLPRILAFCTTHGARIDDIYNLGDMVGDQFSNDFVWPDVDGAENTINIIGNHDTADYTSGIGYDWTAHAGVDAYNKYIAPFVANWGVTQPAGAAENGYCYFYKDYPTQGIRIVSLDVMGYDATQEEWLSATLADAKTNGYAVVIAAHNPSARVTGFPCNYSTLKNNYASLATYNPAITGATTVVDAFINGGGVFVAWLCGHYHRDIIGKLDNTSQLCILVDTANYGTYASSEMYDKVIDTRTQDAFSIVSIDTNAKTVSTFKVGCRFDRWMRDRNGIILDYNNASVLAES